MKINIKYFVLFFVLFFSSCEEKNNKDYEEYCPVVIDLTTNSNIYKECPDLLTKDHLDEIRIIFDKYEEKYIIDDSGDILVPRKLSENKDLVANYTKKAEFRRIKKKYFPYFDIFNFLKTYYFLE